jgi:hypothetical protein
VVTKEYAGRTDPANQAKRDINTGVLQEVFPHKVLLPARSGRRVPPCLNQRSSDLMEHYQNQGTPLTSLMNWDRDRELCSEDLERLLERLQEKRSIPRGKRQPVRSGADQAP